MSDVMNPPQIALPSLDQLNDLTHARKSLLLLRLLHTSDMANLYMVLKGDTLVDLARIIRDELDESNGAAPYMRAPVLTKDERREALTLLVEIETYASRT